MISPRLCSGRIRINISSKKIILLFISLFFITALRAEDDPCKKIKLHSDEDLDLTETEVRMICGDKKVEAYQEIPDYQATYFMTAFLQSRGYLNPRFETVDEVLHVYAGKLSKIKKFKVTAESKKEKKLVKTNLTRKYKKELIVPSRLDQIEKDAKQILREKGFPCPKITSSVDAEKSQLLLDLQEVYPANFGEVKKEPIEGLEPRAFDRFYPFKATDPFNELLLKLTEKRMLRVEVVQGTYFLENCQVENEEAKLALSQNFYLGPPRTLRFGVGASTEEGPMARFRWSNNRYGSMASQLSGNVQASFRSQSVRLQADNYFWKDKPRQSLFSLFEITRQSQIDFEESLIRLTSQMKWTADAGSRYWAWTVGPSLESGTYSTKGDTATKSYADLAIEGSLKWMSHVYEFYDIYPEDGEIFNFNYGFRHPSLGFTDPLLKLDSSYARLAPLGWFGRGRIIGGLRLNAGTTWVADDVGINTLPPSMKFYGGGSEDTRGFLLRTIPNDNGLGALTKVGVKLELRKTNFFTESLQAFTFVDTAYFGEKSWSLLSRTWYSPGAGIRWISPIGLVQVFAARGYISNPYKDNGMLYYVGLGGQF